MVQSPKRGMQTSRPKRPLSFYHLDESTQHRPEVPAVIVDRPKSGKSLKIESENNNYRYIRNQQDEKISILDAMSRRTMTALELHGRILRLKSIDIVIDQRLGVEYVWKVNQRWICSNIPDRLRKDT